MPFTPSDYSLFMCFVWISEQTAITRTCPFNINFLIFTTKTECVYCEVRAESLYFFRLTWQEKLQQQFSFSNTGRESLAQKAPSCEVSEAHTEVNPLNPELNPICYLLPLLGAHHFLHVSRINVKSLTLRRLMSYIYGAPILDVSRSHTATQHSR